MRVDRENGSSEMPGEHTQWLHQYREAASRVGSLTVLEAYDLFRQKRRRTGLASAAAATLAYATQIGRFRRKRSTTIEGISADERAGNWGAPRGWQRTVGELVSLSRQAREPGQGSGTPSVWVRRLQSLQVHNTNDPSQAVVTIVIPAFDSFGEVASCIESVFTWGASRQFCILVSDDASPTCDFAALSALEGVAVRRNSTNLGYIGNVNSAVAECFTEYVVTLNSDVITCPGWLDFLIDEIERDARNVIVGPRVLGDDWRIAESGGVIYRDATASNRGRQADADDSRYNYSCNADYVSGCAMLVRTNFWRKLGGLDFNLAPAYYDDVDLCLRAWESGVLVRYSPLATIVHLEGTSMGVDEHDGNSLKRYQVVNRAKVLASHEELLRGHSEFVQHGKADGHYLPNAEMICVFETLPRMDSDGGSGVAALLLEYLIELGFQVRALCLTQPSVLDSARWRQLGIECLSWDSERAQELMSSGASLLTYGLPIGLEFMKSRRQDARWIHSTVDVATRRLEGMESLIASDQVSNEATRWYGGLPREADKLWELEKALIESADETLFVTQEDIDFVHARGARGRFTLMPTLHGGPDSVDIGTAPSLPIVGFVGSMQHGPNVDAIEHFLGRVWPLVKVQRPDAEFAIWGSGVSIDQKSRWESKEGVRVAGWFASWSDIAPSMRVMVSPLRYGAGLKTKVVSALQAGVPVVGSAISFDGLPGKAHATSIVAEVPEELAVRILEVLENDDTWHQSLSTGLAVMGQEFSRQRDRDGRADPWLWT